MVHAFSRTELLIGTEAIAKLAKANNLDALHDSIHEMARDEARHSAGFMGLYKRYFQK